MENTGTASLEEGEYLAFTHDELSSIRDRAEGLAVRKSLNPRWRRTAAALADAADQLDAMMARAAHFG